MIAWSPLRYPGGKGQMYAYVEGLIKKNNLYGCHYIEPYAGGASIAIRLLLEQKVSKISINDLDRSIYAVWHCILYETNRFIEKIENTDINIKEWKKQRDIQKKKAEVDLFSLGYSTFFLNRTNRSGIINAGPIGGYNQAGNYKIDCRFNKERLIGLISTISEHKKDIFLYNVDGEYLINNCKKQNVLYFIDPPYYKQGKKLYENYFDHTRHLSLSKTIKNILYVPFILTYDVCKEIIDLYDFIPKQISELHYSLNQKRKAEELLYVNLL